MRILVAEDDRPLAKELAILLRSESFAVDLAADGIDAWHLGDTEQYDAAVLDIGLPSVDGLSVLERWRTSARGFPVLVLTARATWADKAAGFQAGADDYLTKPFLPEELVTRLRALIRRANGHSSARIECGGLTFDTQINAITLDERPLDLTAYEFRLLSTLILRSELAVTRDRLQESVYERDVATDFSSLEVIIGRLRRKVGFGRIQTVRGFGYKLVSIP